MAFNLTAEEAFDVLCLNVTADTKANCITDTTTPTYTTLTASATQNTAITTTAETVKAIESTGNAALTITKEVGDDKSLMSASFTDAAANANALTEGRGCCGAWLYTANFRV
jgi:hypothetical protein